MLAIGFERYGNLEKLKDDPIHHLYEVYVKINRDAKQDPMISTLAAQYFAKMEQGKLVTHCKVMSILHQRNIRQTHR